MTEPTGLELARQRRAEMTARGEHIVRRTPAERAELRPTSLRLAITAKCWECMGCDADPGVKARVRDCSSPKCSLYPVRPWQNTKGRTGYTDDAGEE